MSSPSNTPSNTSLIVSIVSAILSVIAIGFTAYTLFTVTIPNNEFNNLKSKIDEVNSRVIVVQNELAVYKGTNVDNLTAEVTEASVTNAEADHEWVWGNYDNATALNKDADSQLYAVENSIPHPVSASPISPVILAAIIIAVILLLAIITWAIIVGLRRAIRRKT